MYNGFPAANVTSTGAVSHSIESVRDGVVTRGVLLDLPRLRGAPWLDAGEAVYRDDLEAAESAQNLRVAEGDVVFLHTGRHRRNREGEPSLSLAGLHATSVPWLRERGVAILGCDGISDVQPSGMPAGGIPVHVLTIAGMGIHLIDNVYTDAVAEACAERGRWEFLFVLAPLVLLRGTASPVNPLAIF